MRKKSKEYFHLSVSECFYVTFYLAVISFDGNQYQCCHSQQLLVELLVVDFQPPWDHFVMSIVNTISVLEYFQMW